MMKKIIKIIQGALMLLAAIIFAACNNQWDDHIAIRTQALEGNVLDAIKTNEKLSDFYILLQETGYDKILQRGYEYTVLAPDNDAMAVLIMEDEATKLAVVRNHIAFSTYNIQLLSQQDCLKMINGKNLTLAGLSFDDTESNILCENGILHVVDKVVKPMMSIDEYLQTYPKKMYEQIDSLYAKTTKMMDMEKSIQKGVNEEGEPVYDTVWITRNYFFEKMPMNNEDSTFTFVVLEDENFKAIKNKYAKYMRQKTDELTDSLATNELICDLVFKKGEQAAVSGTIVDFTNAVVTKEYQASNGVVRFMKGVDIKMADKLKTVYIEGEDFSSALTTQQIYVRSRTWARGGRDVMVSSQTYQIDPSNPDKKYRFYYSYTNTINKSNNFYLKYDVPLYSTTYDVYWVSYDDMEEHCNVDGDGVPAATLKVCQKLFASMPGEPELTVSSSVIKNNYLGDTEGFVAASKAGVFEEAHLQRYPLVLDTKLKIYQRPQDYPITEGDPFGFEVSRMGNVVLMVCNSATFGEEYANVTETDRGAGMMFLDYIKFVPRVAEGD
ncbi:MAG: fasciclin domain-containing protein [Bacteroides xylanisolvens]